MAGLFREARIVEIVDFDLVNPGLDGGGRRFVVGR